MKKLLPTLLCLVFTMQEGYGVVKWLQSKGITGFLLKYRLMHIQGSDPYISAFGAFYFLLAAIRLSKKKKAVK